MSVPDMSTVVRQGDAAAPDRERASRERATHLVNRDLAKALGAVLLLELGEERTALGDDLLEDLLDGLWSGGGGETGSVGGRWGDGGFAVLARAGAHVRVSRALCVLE